MISCENLPHVKGFECTGSDESPTWNKLHKLPDDMNCQYCAGEAKRMFNGLHDVVNMGLGKNAEKLDDFNYLVAKVNAVKTACKVDNRC